MLCFADAAARSMGGKKPSPFSNVRAELPVVHGVIATAASSFRNAALCAGGGFAGTWRMVPVAHAPSGRARAATMRRRRFKARPCNHTRPHKASVRVKAVVISRRHPDVYCDVILRGRALDPILLTRIPCAPQSACSRFQRLVVLQSPANPGPHPSMRSAGRGGSRPPMKIQSLRPAKSNPRKT